MTKYSFRALMTVIFCALVGYYSATASWGGMIFIRGNGLGDRRAPAAISKVFDFSQLQGNALRLASQKRLLSDAHVLSAESSIGIELGHFVTKGDSGERLFACEYYDRIELSFSSDGVAVEGERPKMMVEAPCNMGRDLNRMAPIWIPIKKISQEKPGDIDLSYSQDEDVHFRFDNINRSWPKTWVLSSVRIFHSSKAGHEISISEAEIRDISGGAMQLHW